MFFLTNINTRLGDISENSLITTYLTKKIPCKFEHCIDQSDVQYVSALIFVQISKHIKQSSVDNNQELKKRTK